MKTGIVLFIAAVATAAAQLPGNPAADQVSRLRFQREKAISDSIAKANAEYSDGLDKLKALYPSDANTAALVAKEKEALAKVAVVTLPPVVKIEGPIAGAAPKAPRQRPSIHKPDDLAHYLVGTKWHIYTSGNFLGPARVMEFTAPGKLVIDGKEQTWKAVDKSKVWLEGNSEFTFNKDFDEFTGGWIPNPAEKRSGKLITE